MSATRFPAIDIDAVLDGAASPSAHGRRRIGASREGRPLFAYALGQGPRSISLIAGCHADEPVGPAMLDRFTAWLQGLDADHPWLTDFTWRLVPHTNPDGEATNEAWTKDLGPPEAWTRAEDPVEVNLSQYLNHVVREKPGHDLEFGFPRPGESQNAAVPARPEAYAIAAFLEPAAPFALHASFHGMAFAAGPWFLIEKSWIDRTAAMRESLRREVTDRGYRVHDIDRRGEKGFERIDLGFTTRPDSKAMEAHFLALGDPEMAARFRPSSMEFARSLGGDAMTFVSEMPLFILPPEAFPADKPVHVPATSSLRLAATKGPLALGEEAASVGVRAMPLRDQMYFQLAFLKAALLAVRRAEELQDGLPAADTPDAAS